MSRPTCGSPRRTAAAGFGIDDHPRSATVSPNSREAGTANPAAGTPAHHHLPRGELGSADLRAGFPSARGRSWSCLSLRPARPIAPPMNATLRLGRIAGIEVGAHWSLLLAVALIVWSLA